MTQQQIIQQEKLASIGRLSAGIAHEINNPLGYISSNIETARVYFSEYKEIMAEYRKLVDFIDDNKLEELKDEVNRIKRLEMTKNIRFISEDLDAIFDDIENGLLRISEIVSSLKAFSRSDDNEEYEDYDLNESIKNTLLIAKNDIKYNARVKQSLGQIPKIQAKGNKVDQVLLNIILNASSAIKEKQGITTDYEEGLITITTDKSNSYVRCIIEDNGIGIEEVNLSKIFDPFYTSKPTGEGTGLGLSIAHEIIVTGHGGQLLVESEPMVGTKFIILLPIDNENNSETHD